MVFEPSSSTPVTKKGQQSSCIPLWQLQTGVPLNCLTVEHLSNGNDRAILTKCETYPPREQKWSMIESGNDGTRICQDGSDNCLTYDPNRIVRPDVSILKRRDESAKTQLFKMDIETSKLVIVEPGSCVVGVFKSSFYVPGIEVRSCDENTDKITFKKWSVVPLKNCL